MGRREMLGTYVPIPHPHTHTPPPMQVGKRGSKYEVTMVLPTPMVNMCSAIAEK